MSLKFKPWNKIERPRKILVLRFHALGDIIITLPYLASLKKHVPSTSLTLLTSREFSDIPKGITLFDEVLTFNSNRNGKLQFLLCALKLPFLFLQGFDVVLDLQNNRSSRLIRFFLFTTCWSEFDKSSHHSAGERTRACIDSLGLSPVAIENCIPLKNDSASQKLLEVNDLKPFQFIVINPAGAFPSRNWPLENYITFCKMWISKAPEIKFLILGTNIIKAKALHIKKSLGDSIVDLCNQTTQVEAFALVKSAKLMLTEDGGLMHMAWVQGVPTLALFGSSPSYWSAPQGRLSLCLHSSDMPCGDCLLEVCKFENNPCLTRHSSQEVFEKSVQLLYSIN
jgi:heptosyltransferase-2